MKYSVAFPDSNEPTDKIHMATGKLHSIRFTIIAITLLPLLTSCATVDKITRSIAHPQASGSHATGDTGTDTGNKNDNEALSAEARIIPPSQEITPVSSIQKSNLSISYSLKPIQGKYEKLLRLTVIIKNLSGRSRHIWPHVYLADSRGKAVDAYSLRTFQRILSRAATHHTKGGLKPGEWADMYWLKSSYRLPPHGIVIGERVYHGKKFHFPVKLTVRIYKTYFKFPSIHP